MIDSRHLALAAPCAALKSYGVFMVPVSALVAYEQIVVDKASLLMHHAGNLRSESPICVQHRPRSLFFYLFTADGEAHTHDVLADIRCGIATTLPPTLTVSGWLTQARDAAAFCAGGLGWDRLQHTLGVLEAKLRPNDRPVPQFVAAPAADAPDGGFKGTHPLGLLESNPLMAQSVCAALAWHVMTQMRHGRKPQDVLSPPEGLRRIVARGAEAVGLPQASGIPLQGATVSSAMEQAR